jgi:hypothetical protein
MDNSEVNSLEELDIFSLKTLNISDVYALYKRAYEFPPNVISIIKEIDVESLLV